MFSKFENFPLKRGGVIKRGGFIKQQKVPRDFELERKNSLHWGATALKRLLGVLTFHNVLSIGSRQSLFFIQLAVLQVSSLLLPIFEEFCSNFNLSYNSEFLNCSSYNSELCLECITCNCTRLRTGKMRPPLAMMKLPTKSLFFLINLYGRSERTRTCVFRESIFLIKDTFCNYLITRVDEKLPPKIELVENHEKS